jgi:hypothetical protein
MHPLQYRRGSSGVLPFIELSIGEKVPDAVLVAVQKEGELLVLPRLLRQTGPVTTKKLAGLGARRAAAPRAPLRNPSSNLSLTYRAIGVRLS